MSPAPAQDVPVAAVSRETLRLRALMMREQGAKYRQIAEAMGLPSVSQAHDLVSEAFAELHDKVLESAENLKTIELNRLDDYLYKLTMKLSRQTINIALPNGTTQDVPNPDERTIETLLKVMEKRSKLLGLDAPEPMAAPRGMGANVDAEMLRVAVQKRIQDLRRGRLMAGATTGEEVIVVQAPKPFDPLADPLPSNDGADVPPPSSQEE